MIPIRKVFWPLLFWPLLAPTQEPVDLFTRSTTDLGQGVYSFGSFSTRSLFVVGADGVIVTDPANPEHAAAMLAAVRDITALPIKYLVYSHQHWDHALGGQVFKDQGALFVSHENCVKHWQLHPHEQLVMPDVTLSESGALTLGDRTVRLEYYGPNHGDCVLIMRLDGHDVLYVNDLVTPYSVGLGFMPDYDPAEWVRTLRELEADTNWARMVGAHGVAVAPREALSQRRRYLEALMAAVREGIDQGKRFDALYDSIELPQEFRQLRGYDSQLRRAAERIYHFYTMGW